ncbi:MAG: PQQ-binding-like beta-propeller repeat protein, partial [Planctomycetes bacterium]|nr:PQQ-binding-like beta-propeller repeat protein [Planctomycetota bacterium]
IDAPVSAIDAATGRTIRVYEGTERTEEILVNDGVLYLIIGTSEIYRRGGGLFERGEPKPTDYRYVTAIEASTGKTLWKNVCAKNEFLLPLSLAVNRNGVFYQSTAGMVRLDCKSGEEVWKTPRPTPRMRMSFSSPTVVATDEVLLCADRSASKDNKSDGKVVWGVNGWNEAGFPRRGKSILTAYSVKDGKELWSVACSEGYNSAVDVFVVGETVWVGANFTGYDLKTGELVRQLDWKGPPVAMAHHRCYRDKASEKFIFTGRAGIEVVSLDEGWLSNNSWIRGTCQYGIMPANGLLYAPPDACACFPKVKVAGFFAAASQRGKSGKMPFPDKPVLEKGPAWGVKLSSARALPDDWPTYRHDGARSGATSTSVTSATKKLWSADLGGALTQAVIAGGRVFVASRDTHTVYALSAETGDLRWSYTAGGRIDSAPTIYRGMVFFGCADGWVYALIAGDGRLVWRFRAAPQEQQVCVLDQLESIWPVHGAILVQNDTVYATAGRSTYLDGGIVLYRLNPATGKTLARTVVSDLDPDTGKQTGFEPSRGFDMEGSLSDILSGDGDSVFMKHLNFDKAGNKVDEQKPHLFCITGFLGEEWFVRSYWLIGTDVGAGWGGWARSSQIVPTGRILCFDEDRIFGYGRKEIASGPVGHRLDSYQLFAKTKIMTQTKSVPKAPKKQKGAGKPAAVKPEPGTWSNDRSLVVRAMVLTPDKLVVAGPPDVGRKESKLLAYENEAETLAAFKGEKGTFLQVVSSSDGEVLGQCKLDAMCVFDGMSAASGRIFVSLKDGTLQCWGQ